MPTQQRGYVFSLKLKISVILSRLLEGSNQYTINSNVLLKG